MIIRLADWRAMRRTQDMRDAFSSDPLVRAQARVRSLLAIARAEQRALSRTRAPVLWLDTRMYELRLRVRRAKTREDAQRRAKTREDGERD